MNINDLRGTLLALAVLFVGQGQALELKTSYGSVNAGYANWNDGFVNTHRGEVWKATADFGAVFDKAEFYSFFESNVLNHPVEGRNHVLSAQTHVRLLDSDFSFMGKLYGQFENKWGDELNMMYGFGYLGWAGPQGFIKPYVALHNLSSDYTSKEYGQANGLNGYIVGWTAAWFFDLWGEKMVLANWNEFELDRNDAYAEQQHSKNGINGGLTLTWKFYPHLKASMTYRYFDNKLGYEDYGDQLIYMLGYEF